MEDKHGMARDRNSGFYVAPGDVLRFDVYSSVASLQVMLSGYYRDMGGEVKDIAIFVSPTSDRVISTGQQIIGGGFILSLTASLLSGNANRGQCYVRASVRNSLSGQAVPIAQLIGGYVTDDYMPSFPFGKVESSVEGPGAIIQYATTAPGAGNEIDVIQPARTRWRLIDFHAKLTASAAGANRLPTLTVYRTDGATSAWGCNVAITANQAIDIYWTSGSLNGAITLSAQHVSIGERMLLGNQSLLDTITGDMQAGDAYTNIWHTVEEWIEI